MLEQLFNLIQQESEHEIISNPVIPNDHNNQAVGLATESIFNGLQGALANGGLKDVLGMFTGSSAPSTNNPIVGGIVNNMVGGLMKKFGIDSPAATSIAASLIPKVLASVVGKTNDPTNKNFDINGIIGALTGGSTQQGSPVQFPGTQQPQAPSGSGVDFGGILKSITSGGLDANNDGKMGLDDIIGMVSKAASGVQQQQPQQQPQQQQSDGGMLHMLKGLIGG
jgi:hypothetical protein